MPGVMFGVISYLPNDERVRSVRWKTTVKCISNLLLVSGWVGQPLHIVTTNWNDEEIAQVRSFAPLSRICFHTVEMEHRGAAVSRNVLLKTLYTSDSDYLLICDDDVHIYPYYDLEQFFVDLHNHPDRYLSKNLLHICAHLANSAPFKEKNLQDINFIDYWTFYSGGDHAGRCPQIFANFRRYIGEEVYQREYLYNELHLGGEDGCFDLDLMAKGVMAYTLSAFIAGTTEITSSFWNEKKSKQEMLKDAVWEEGQGTLDYIKSTFPKVRQITKYRLDFSAYEPPHKKQVFIPRNTPYTFVDSDMPKKRTKKVYLGLLKNL